MSMTPASIKDIGAEEVPARPKFAISVEKKIEHLWLESEARGLSFSDLVVVVMEVLAVLHHRNKLRSVKDNAGHEAPGNGA